MLLAKKKVFDLHVAIWLILLIAPPLSAEEAGTPDQPSRPSLGGPDAVENQMESDRIERGVLIESSLFKPYFAWKEGISNRGGPSLGTDYTSVYLSANDNLPGTSDDAFSGMVRFWNLGATWARRCKYGYAEF